METCQGGHGGRLDVVICAHELRLAAGKRLFLVMLQYSEYVVVILMLGG